MGSRLPPLYGIYVPDNKVPGVFVSLGTTLKTSSAGRLFVATKAGSETGTTAVESFSTLPGNLLVTQIGFDTADHNYGVNFLVRRLSLSARIFLSLEAP